MASAPAWPIEATSLGGVTCGTLAFKTAGRIHVAIVVKATFAFVRDRAMAPIDPEPIAVTDQHLEQNAARSLLAASDLAPYRPGADVTLHGHAVAFQGRPARSFQVRMMIAREGRTILEKLLFVRGSRDRSSASLEPAPFLRMPLVYELAARGIDPGDNPGGIAERPGAEANIVDPRRPGLPAGFGPMPEYWTARRATLGAIVDPRILRSSLPSFPEGFPWAFFHAAPEDQRIPFLYGDEWIALEGMHADTTRVTSALPGARALARVYGNKDDPPGGRPVQLAADTLSIDADRERCSVVWRGSFPIAGASDLGRLRVLAALEVGGRAPAFPAVLASSSAAAAAPSPPSPSASASASSTQSTPSTPTIQASPSPPASRRVVPEMPFVAAAAAPVAAPKPRPRHVDSGTRAIPAITEEQARSAPAMPFAPGAVDPGTAPASRSPIARPVMPFAPAAAVGEARRVVALDQTITPEAEPPRRGTPFDRFVRPAAPIDDPLARTITPEPRSRIARRTMPFSAITARPSPASSGSGTAPTAPIRPMAATPFARVAPPIAKIALDQTMAPEASVIPRSVVPFAPVAPARSPAPPPPEPEAIAAPEASYLPRDARPRDDLAAAATPVITPMPMAPPVFMAPPAPIAAPDSGEAPTTLGAHFLAAMRRHRAAAAPA
jgi:hypothetical protein